MKCKLCEDKLLEYLYGELGEEEAAAMERHLEASEACRQAYEGFASVLDAVAEEGEEGPSPALHTRIMGHAEEARPARRAFWAWMFRPAVTTAVIGTVAAGVYFTTLRHKPPSYLDERILSEKSLLGKSLVEKSKQRSTPPSSRPMVDSPLKLAKDEAFLARPAASEPPDAIEQEEAAPELSEALDKLDPVMRARPPEAKTQYMAVGSMDGELAPAQARKKSDAIPAEEDRAVAGGMEREASQAYGARAVPLSAPPGRDLAYEAAPVPPAIEQALDLASEGQCAEAGKRLETFTNEHPKQKASGAGWLEVARCHAKKGDIKAAREMAEKALEIPAYESESRAFLASLPP